MSNKNNTLYYQQGDVLFFKVGALPKENKKLTTTIIQEGESTGHAHVIEAPVHEFVENNQTKERFLKLIKGGTVVHEEHKEITLPAGIYKIGIVRERDPYDNLIRSVRD